MSNRSSAKARLQEKVLPAAPPNIVREHLSSPDNDWRVFAPTLDDSGQSYARLSIAIAKAVDPCESLKAIAREAAAGGDDIDALRMRAAALVLHDLIAMGWGVRNARHYLEIRPPSGDGADAKQSIRRQLEFGRDDQLREPATRKFIMGLERPGRGSRLKPITDLIADGRLLAQQFAPIARLPREGRLVELAKVCQPYLQLVDAETVDEHTGLRLMDIWRYFRHSWATRYKSSPGRNLFYLIRDAAQPNHPVMGITALGNAVMQLTSRDLSLGWTVEGVQRLIATGVVSDREVIEAFRNRLIEDFDQIDTADLPVPSDPTGIVAAETLDRLRVIEEKSIEDRTKRLKDDDDDETMLARVGRPEDVDLHALARSPLFRAKRARAVREILRALQIFRGVTTIGAMVKTEEGNWAVQQVIRQLKKQLSATAIMEITVCGGVAPYTHLLGGKLACLMMLSPRVVRDYANRYASEASIIASQMAGRLIVKQPTLVFLGTSSLYTQRSSQYNRVRIPENALPGQTAELAYLEYGISLGYGSPNLSIETESVLQRLSVLTRAYRNVNHLFGEGQSPKLRRLREGFDTLGLQRANLLHHAANRIVYGAPLATNCARFLLGIDQAPSYALPATEDADEQIADFWRSRWLASRLDHAPALHALSEASPITTRVSRLMPPTAHGPQDDLFDHTLTPKERRMAQPPKDDEKIAFLRNFYRHESAYSDDVQISRLRQLNVKTGLEDVIRKIVRAGGSVVITGNAGDGKTHTIRMLQSSLVEANAKVIIDASEHTSDEVLAAWKEARSENRPFCIAINEGPLIDLIRAHKAKEPWLDDLQRDLLNLISYVRVEVDDHKAFTPEADKTVVIDLSLRRTLSPDLLQAIVTKLTDDNWYSGCAACPGVASCPVTYNRRMLREVHVRDRLIELLARVAERGVRTTFRQVLAFVSYIIFSGRSCAELLADAKSEQTRYYWNAFEGQGAIFESLVNGLDPMRQTAPKIDEDLWNGRYSPEAFIGHQHVPVIKRSFDEIDEHESTAAIGGYTALKRRWYFEHPEGKLSLMSPADEIFAHLKDPVATPQLRAVRLIGLINSWWNPKDADQEDSLRLWTRLAYSPRAQGRAMVSGRRVQGLKLHLFKPVLSPALRAAFGEAVIDHLKFGPPDNLRYASLTVDRKLIEVLLSHGVSEDERRIERQLTQFNDALSRHADAGTHVRTIELLDPVSDLEVRIRVDLSQRRYDSAQ